MNEETSVEGRAVKNMIETEEFLIGDFIAKLIEESKKQPINYERISTLCAGILKSITKREAMKDIQSISECVNNLRTNN